MAKACVICGGEEASGEQFLQAPCQHHWVCTDDIGSFFERATENESLYPPKCCGQIFLLDLYEDYVPFEVQWAYQMKEQGEYSVMAKYRIYCASPACSKFLSPSTHVKDTSANITYAICQDNTCGRLTCTSCKTLLDGTEGHACEQNEDYKKFKQTATEKGFQECPTCASTVELAEACNHITCECGTEFCYVCGEQWPGIHGCPHYGRAIYDEEGYNQEGYHRTTGLDREGRTRREQRRINQVEGDDSEEEDDDEAEEEDAHLNDPGWEVLQHVDPDLRATFAALPHGEREMFLVNLQIRLFEERGITFPDLEEEGEAEGGDGEEDDDEDDDEEGSENNDGAGQDDNTEQGADPVAQGEDPVGVETGADINFEAARAAMTAAMQTPDSTGGQPPEDRAANGMTVDQYISHISEDNSAKEVEGEATARTTNPAELAGMLQNMLAHLALRTIPHETIREAFEVLDAEHPGNAELANFRLFLSRFDQPFIQSNPEQDENPESSSATSPDEDQPATPIVVDPATEDCEEERPGWKVPPGGWPDDEEL